MKRLISLITLTVFVFMTSGCAGLMTSRLDPDYVALKTLEITQEQKPMFEFELTADGKIKSFKGYEKRNPVIIEQPRPHPMWAVLDTLVRMSGYFGIAWTVGDTVVGLAESGQGSSTSIVNSGANSGNSGTVSLTEMAPAVVP